MMKPLKGIKVLDLSRVLAGPTVGMILGDLGADVIKVERPGVGDETRGWGPPFKGGESAYYMCANRNKRSMTLDLKHPKGREILEKLIKRSDVMILNFLPKTLESLKLTYEDVA
ncbi:MAG TPA: CoA transferase, partial [candidate division WOR-3 bacterium]|nr:CoA transferase [candidate division WOR-3 bacterium]